MSLWHGLGLEQLAGFDVDAGSVVAFFRQGMISASVRGRSGLPVGVKERSVTARLAAVRMFVVALAVTGIFASAALSARQVKAAAGACDRACLDGFVDQYLAALLAHDPSRAPLAKNVRFTENAQILKVGDALWGTISGFGKYKFYFEDPQDGQVGFFGTIRENDVPAILAVRLKVQDQKITEIETVVPRFDNTDDKDGPEELDTMGKPNPVYAETVPKQREFRGKR